MQIKIGDIVGNTVQGFDFLVLDILKDKFTVKNIITGEVFNTYKVNMYLPKGDK